MTFLNLTRLQTTTTRRWRCNAHRTTSQPAASLCPLNECKPSSKRQGVDMLGWELRSKKLRLVSTTRRPLVPCSHSRKVSSSSLSGGAPSAAVLTSIPSSASFTPLESTRIRFYSILHDSPSCPLTTLRLSVPPPSAHHGKLRSCAVIASNGRLAEEQEAARGALRGSHEVDRQSFRRGGYGGEGRAAERDAAR